MQYVRVVLLPSEEQDLLNDIKDKDRNPEIEKKPYIPPAKAAKFYVLLFCYMLYLYIFG